MLNIKSGEKFRFQVQDDKIILQRTTSTEDFIKKSEAFSEILKKTSKNPIEFKKMFD